MKKRIIGWWYYITNHRYDITKLKGYNTVEYPKGCTAKDAMKFLEKNTHCGVYWDCKAHYIAAKQIVYIHMEGNEYVEIDLKGGTIKRVDLD